MAGIVTPGQAVGYEEVVDGRNMRVTAIIDAAAGAYVSQEWDPAQAATDAFNGASYNGATGDWTLTRADASAPLVINTPIETSFTGITYTPGTNILEITANVDPDGAGPIVQTASVDLSGLFDPVSVADTATINLTQIANGEITADLTVSGTAPAAGKQNILAADAGGARADETITSQTATVAALADAQQTLALTFDDEAGASNNVLATTTLRSMPIETSLPTSAAELTAQLAKYPTFQIASGANAGTYSVFTTGVVKVA